MEKTTIITEGEFHKLVAETTAEIMADHGKDTPEAAMLFSLSSVVFAAALARKLFPKDEDDKKIQTEPSNEPSIEQMREELTDFCHKRTCFNCPMEKSGFECGRGKTFNTPVGNLGYMNNESIIRHYKAMKGAQL